SIGDAGEEGEKIGHDTALVLAGGTFASHLKDTNPARGARAETFRLAGTIVKRCEMGRRLYSRGLISDQLETLIDVHFNRIRTDRRRRRGWFRLHATAAADCDFRDLLLLPHPPAAEADEAAPRNGGQREARR